jgi:Tfp pilus assembly protein PilX
MKEKGFIGLISLLIGVVVIAIMSLTLLRKEYGISKNSSASTTPFEEQKSAIKAAEEAKAMIELRYKNQLQ